MGNINSLIFLIILIILIIFLQVCPPCRKCKSCHVPRVDYFVGNLALCAVCFHLRQHGNYCPLCQQCYESDDFETKVNENILN